MKNIFLSTVLLLGLVDSNSLFASPNMEQNDEEIVSIFEGTTETGKSCSVLISLDKCLVQYSFEKDSYGITLSDDKFAKILNDAENKLSKSPIVPIIFKDLAVQITIYVNRLGDMVKANFSGNRKEETCLNMQRK